MDVALYLKRNVMSSSAGAPLWFCLVLQLGPFDDITRVACVVPLRQSRSLHMYPATINTSLSSAVARQTLDRGENLRLASENEV